MVAGPTFAMAVLCPRARAEPAGIPGGFAWPAGRVFWAGVENAGSVSNLYGED
jgi:hypothetical protein